MAIKVVNLLIGSEEDQIGLFKATVIKDLVNSFPEVISVLDDAVKRVKGRFRCRCITDLETPNHRPFVIPCSVTMGLKEGVDNQENSVLNVATTEHRDRFVQGEEQNFQNSVNKSIFSNGKIDLVGESFTEQLRVIMNHYELGKRK